MESDPRPQVAAPAAAIIIAGGKGERLRPLTNTRPKCLVEVAGRPILDWQLASLERAGVKRVAIVGHYLFEAIEAFVAGRPNHLRVDLIREERPLGRGGAIKLGYSELGTGGSALALNGDILCDLDFARLEALRIESGTAAAILAVPLRSPYGILELEHSRVTAFREKPVLDHWINGGIYDLSEEALHLFPDEGDHEDSTFPDLAAQGRVSALRFSGAWRSIDSLKDLREAEELAAAGAFGGESPIASLAF
jgi:mannose-1-phosphate guanylyltransferase